MKSDIAYRIVTHAQWYLFVMSKQGFKVFPETYKILFSAQVEIANQ